MKRQHFYYSQTLKKHSIILNGTSYLSFFANKESTTEKEDCFTTIISTKGVLFVLVIRKNKLVLEKM